MATKKKIDVLTIDQRKHLLSRICDINRRAYREAQKPASVLAAEKSRDAAEKVIRAWKEKQCELKCTATNQRSEAAAKALSIVYFPKTAEDAVAAVDKFDREFGKEFESDSCYC